jgi:hypothetical protein
LSGVGVWGSAAHERVAAVDRYVVAGAAWAA